MHVVYDDEGQIRANMLMRCKLVCFKIHKTSSEIKIKMKLLNKAMQTDCEKLWRHHCFSHEAILISDHFTVAIGTVKILYKAV